MVATPKASFNGMLPGTFQQYEEIRLSKLRIYKNLVVLSISWWMLFSAYDGLVMLQSTLNSAKGVGVISVATQHACACVSAVLFPKYFVKKLGCKRAIIVCMLSHAPFIASNFYPHWLLMIPSSILLGAANPLIWAAACAYLVNLSRLFSEHIENGESQRQCKCDTADLCVCNKITEKQNGSFPYGSITEDGFNDSELRNSLYKNGIHKGMESPKNTASKILENTTACFFGFHGTVYTLNVVTSNIMSYYILRIGNEHSENVTNATCTCGSGFSNKQVGCFDTNLKPPTDEIRYILIGVFSFLVILSIVIVAMFLDDLNRNRKSVSFSTSLLMAALKLMKRSNMFLLIPMILNIGIIQGFFMGDYTQAYVGCSWGIHNVGLVTATFGLGLSVCSVSSGWFVKYIGRPPILLFATALNIATIAILLLWVPDGEKPAMLFVVSFFFGVFTSLYWTQIRAFLGIIFKADEEAAFGNYQLWHSVGLSIAFGYSKYIYTSIKIYILLAVCICSILGYLSVERSYSRGKKEINAPGN